MCSAAMFGWRLGSAGVPRDLCPNSSQKKFQVEWTYGIPEFFVFIGDILSLGRYVRAWTYVVDSF